MPQLTEAQLVILCAAAQRDGGAALPLPESLSINKGAARTVLASLLRQGFVAERPTAREDGAWREADDGQRLTLAITAAGCEAIGVEPDEGVGTQPAEVEASPEAPNQGAVGGLPDDATATPTTAIRPGTKQAQVIGMLRRDGGATVAEICQVTGWQPHSVRGAISGTIKKKLDLPVASDTIAGRGRVYRITAVQ